MGISREELFNKAKELRKQAKVEKSNNSFSGEDYEQIHYTGVPTTGLKVIRIIGDPLAMRTKPSDPKFSLISMILADNDKKFRCIWPTQAQNKNWILWKVFNTVMDGNWEKGPDGKNVKVLKYSKSHPECVRRIEKNNSDNKFERGWYPAKFVNMNIIDRHDPSFHSEKKHSKLISKRASEMGDTGKFWFDPGVPEMVYNLIWDDIVEFSGLWENYDVAIMKLKETPWYKVYHCDEDINKVLKLDADVEKLIVKGPMTAEEKAYELYDLDAMYGITSYTKIKVKLGDFIKKVDIDFKKNFTDELEELVKIEQKEFAIKKAEREAAKASEVKTAETTTVKEVAKTEKPIEKQAEVKADKEAIKEPTVRSRVAKETSESKVDWEGLISGSFNTKVYAGVSLLTDDEKEMVLSVKEDGSFDYVKVFKGHTIESMKNPRSGFMSPDLFHVDPLNGDLFQ